MLQMPITDLLEYHSEQTKFSDREFVKALAENLDRILKAYKIDAKITDCRRTSLSVMFDVMLEQGVSVKVIRNLRTELEIFLG